ncbi:hypothetical protein [Terasakiella sp.]|uniref:hypothetical protein n=1 Tax=Terasakiella sp. TaxID=2034861 RepID=UPI003AA8B777
MENLLRRIFYLAMFLVSGTIYTESVHAESYDVVGKIVQLDEREFLDGGKRFISYRLRIKQKEVEDRRIPILFTATVNVEKESEKDQLIRQLSNSGKIGFLKIQKINIRYEIQDVQNVQIIKSNGLFPLPNAFKREGKPTKQIIMDRENRVVISNQRNVSKSVNIGTTGISLGSE